MAFEYISIAAAFEWTSEGLAFNLISISVAIKIITSPRRKSARFRLLEGYADSKMQNPKSSMNRIHKYRLMQAVQIAFDNNDFSEQRTINFKKAETKREKIVEIEEVSTNVNEMLQIDELEKD